MNLLVRDPVCGVELRRAEAAATERYRRRTFWFCSLLCQARFTAEPDRFGQQPAQGRAHREDRRWSS